MFFPDILAQIYILKLVVYYWYSKEAYGIRIKSIRSSMKKEDVIISRLISSISCTDLIYSM